MAETLSARTHARDIQPHDLFSGAERDFLEALRLDPTFIEAHVALARLYYESGRRERAVVHGEFVREFVAEEAENLGDWDAVEAPWLADETTTMLAWAYRELGEWEKGLALVEAAEGFPEEHCLDPSHQLALVKGLLLAGAGRGAEAVRLAVGVLPSFWALRYSGHKAVMLDRRVSISAQESYRLSPEWSTEIAPLLQQIVMARGVGGAPAPAGGP